MFFWGQKSSEHGRNIFSEAEKAVFETQIFFLMPKSLSNLSNILSEAEKALLVFQIFSLRSKKLHCIQNIRCSGFNLVRRDGQIKWVNYLKQESKYYDLVLKLVIGKQCKCVRNLPESLSDDGADLYISSRRP